MPALYTTRFVLCILMSSEKKMACNSKVCPGADRWVCLNDGTSSVQSFIQFSIIVQESDQTIRSTRLVSLRKGLVVPFQNGFLNILFHKPSSQLATRGCGVLQQCLKDKTRVPEKFYAFHLNVQNTSRNGITNEKKKNYFAVFSSAIGGKHQAENWKWASSPNHLWLSLECVSYVSHRCTFHLLYRRDSTAPGDLAPVCSFRPCFQKKASRAPNFVVLHYCSEGYVRINNSLDNSRSCFVS